MSDEVERMLTDPEVTPLHVASMAQEPIALFRHVLENDLSITEFIDSDYVDSDYVMVNDQLAEFYGLPAVDDNEFRSVKVCKAENAPAKSRQANRGPTRETARKPLSPRHSK